MKKTKVPVNEGVEKMDPLDAEDALNKVIGMVAFMNTALCAMNKSKGTAFPMMETEEFGMYEIFCDIESRLKGVVDCLGGGS